MFKKVLLIGGHEIPIDQEEESYVIQQIARKQISVCKQGVFAATSFSAIVEDTDRQYGWNRVIDQKAQKFVPTTRESLPDGFKHIREVVAQVRVPGRETISGSSDPLRLGNQG